MKPFNLSYPYCWSARKGESVFHIFSYGYFTLCEEEIGVPQHRSLWLNWAPAEVCERCLFMFMADITPEPSASVEE